MYAGNDSRDMLKGQGGSKVDEIKLVPVFLIREIRWKFFVKNLKNLKEHVLVKIGINPILSRGD